MTLSILGCRYWSLPLKGALVSGQSVALSAATAVLDSSSTAISMGQADCQALHAVLPYPKAGTISQSLMC